MICYSNVTASIYSADIVCTITIVKQLLVYTIGCFWLVGIIQSGSIFWATSLIKQRVVHRLGSYWEKHTIILYSKQLQYLPGYSNDERLLVV